MNRKNSGKKTVLQMLLLVISCINTEILTTYYKLTYMLPCFGWSSYSKKKRKKIPVYAFECDYYPLD